MKIQSVKYALFSPTGTTQKIVQEMARAMNPEHMEVFEIANPKVRIKPLKTSNQDLLVVAVPVYAGRVPAVLEEWLGMLEADRTPTVCMVTYGNREFDDALLELKDCVIKAGGVPIAGAAFIGEHSFSSDTIPIAVKRPDAADIEQANTFGIKINELIASISSVDDVKDLAVPGNSPYKERSVMPRQDFIEVGHTCNLCGLCAELCPVEAIDETNCTLTDMDKCIYCCACIKVCPEQARTMQESKIKDIALRLRDMCKERKDPVFFFLK